MLKRFIGRFFALLLVGAALAGCGDTPGQTGEFTTVDVDAINAGSSVTSDVSVATSDNAAFIITSTPYTPPPTSSGSIQPSQVAFIDAWVTLDPANSWTPRLPDQYRVKNVTAPPSIEPGASIGVTVDLVTPALKEYLRTLPPPTAAAPFEYYATVSFKGLERNSNREEIISTFNATRITFTGFE